MLQELSDYYPDRWTTANYHNKLHVLVPVPKHSSEYLNIREGEHKIVKIDRVQHPLAYLRYTLQDEYLRSKNAHYTETIKYQIVSMADLKEALDYNCDERRYIDKIYNFQQFLSYCPKENNLRATDVVVIVKFRNHAITTDNNHYPMYVLYF